MRSSSLITFTWLAGALLAASGCSVITSLADWTFGDDDPGQMDAGPRDAGQMDASPDEDGGPDCAPGLTECAGECVDLDSSPDHCGACENPCPTPPNTVALCTDRSCDWECAAGFADCNGDPVDGCEIEIASDPLNCGACENSCVNDLASLSCREGSCRPRLLWINDFGDTGPHGDATVTAVVLDPEGNVYITGSLYGAINLGDNPIMSEGTAFIASFTSGGAYRWWAGEDWSGEISPLPTALAFDGSGSTPKVHVTGSFRGTVSFGGDPLTSKDGSDDVFIASFDATNGSHLGSRGWGGSSSDWAKGIGVDAAGNIYVIGDFRGSDANFGGLNLTSRGGWDIFLASYPPDYDVTGYAHWTERFGHTSDDHGEAIAVDASGNVYITGSFSGEINFGPLPPSLLTSEGSDAFIASFNSHGTHDWSTQAMTSSGRGYGLALDAESNVYVTGSFAPTANFGGDSLSADEGQVFLASYDASGSHRWSLGMGGTQGIGAAIAVSLDGEVYSTGFFVQTATFGGADLTSWDQAGFVAAHGAMNGAHQASFAIGGPEGSAEGDSVAAGGGVVCTVGRYIGKVKIGRETLITGDNRDSFLACFEP